MRRGALVAITAALATGLASGFLVGTPQTSLGLKATTTPPPALVPHVSGKTTP